MTQTASQDDTPQEWSIGELLHEIVDRVFRPGTWETEHAHRSIEKEYPTQDTTDDTASTPAAPATPVTEPAATNADPNNATGTAAVPPPYPTPVNQ